MGNGSAKESTANLYCIFTIKQIKQIIFTKNEWLYYLPNSKSRNVPPLHIFVSYLQLYSVGSVKECHIDMVLEDGRLCIHLHYFCHRVWGLWWSLLPSHLSSCTDWTMQL